MGVLNFIGDFALYNALCNLFSRKRKPIAAKPAPYYRHRAIDDRQQCDFDRSGCSEIDSLQDRIDALERRLDDCDVLSDDYDDVQDRIDELYDRIDDDDCIDELDHQVYYDYMDASSGDDLDDW